MPNTIYTLRADTAQGFADIHANDADVLRRFGLSFYVTTAPRPRVEIFAACGTILDYIDHKAENWYGRPIAWKRCG